MRRLLNIRPHGGGRILLGLVPLLAVALFYLVASEARHAQNIHDKLLPTASAMVEAVKMMATVDPLTGQAPLLVDTAASLKRISTALVIATGITLILGLVITLLPISATSLLPKPWLHSQRRAAMSWRSRLTSPNSKRLRRLPKPPSTSSARSI